MVLVFDPKLVTKNRDRSVTLDVSALADAFQGWAYGASNGCRDSSLHPVCGAGRVDNLGGNS